MHGPSDVLRCRILIVDDHESNVRLLEYTLRRGGYLEVSSTMDPTEVSALHVARPYDLIVLDLQMPVMDGFGVMKSLDAAVSAQDRPIILVMSADPSQAARVLQAGANSFLSKPYVLGEFLTRIHLLLDQTAPPCHEQTLAPAA